MKIIMLSGRVACACVRVNTQLDATNPWEGIKTEEERGGMNGMVAKELCVKRGLDLNTTRGWAGD